MLDLVIWLLFGLGQLLINCSCDATPKMFPLVEQDKISNRACDDFQGWGVLSLATPVLKFGETNEFSYVVGNQSGWVGKLTQNFLNPFDIPSRP